MKVTKSKLKQIIIEEIESNEPLIRAIEALTDRIEDLDISVDFLSAAFLGDSPLSIGAAQRQLGRSYNPTMRRAPEPRVDEVVDMQRGVCEELRAMIDERYSGLESQEISDKEARELKNQIDVLEKLSMMEGCADEDF
jgi:hypothetical protein